MRTMDVLEEQIGINGIAFYDTNLRCRRADSH